MRCRELQDRAHKLVVLLAAREARALLRGRALWVLLCATTLLSGSAFIDAVALYAEASRSAAGQPELARALQPLDGVIVPTFGALYLSTSLMLPFVVIAVFGDERRSGALKFLLQLRAPSALLVAAKLAALGAAFAVALIPSLVGLALWRIEGGHVPWASVAVVMGGHVLYAFVVIGICAVAAVLADGGPSAPISALGVTIGSWVLELNVGKSAAVDAAAALSPTSALRTFESGLFSLTTTLVLCVVIAALAAVVAAMLHPGAGWRRRLAHVAAIAFVACAASFAASRATVYVDATPDRRLSFAPPVEAALAGFEEPIRVVVHLSVSDPRLFDLERSILAKLTRAAPDVTIERVDDGSSSSSDARYGVVEYQVGEKRGESRSTSAAEVLPLLFELAGRTASLAATDDADADDGDAGHPLVAEATLARPVFFVVLPLTIVGGFALTRVRRRSSLGGPS